jgi:hypothetical protein
MLLFCTSLSPERGTTYKYLIGPKYSILRTMDSIRQIEHNGSWQPHLFVPVLVKAGAHIQSISINPLLVENWVSTISQDVYVHQSQFVGTFLNINKVQVPILVKDGAHIQKHLNKPFTAWELGHPPFHKMLCPPISICRDVFKYK